MTPAPQPKLSIVIPCYNEEAVLPLLRARLLQVLSSFAFSWEVILVDDGSSDSTFLAISSVHREDDRFKVISFSRNFGHQAAILAGLHAAAGAHVAVMDADLQDPPEILPECLNLLKKGFDVIYAVRRKRKETWPKVAAYRIFYRILKLLAEISIPLDAGDFCLMDRKVVDAIIASPERNIFVRGLRAWAGFRQISVEYEREARAAGETKYPFSKLCRLAADGIFSFSSAPLRLATVLGFVVTLLSLLAILFVLLWRGIGFSFMGHVAAELPGWSAVMAALLFLSGIQLLILGFLGEYIGRIYSEVKQRPRWLVRESLGTFPKFPGDSK